MEIKVLGPGCANCHKMEEMTKQAVKELGIDARSRRSPISGTSHGTASCQRLVS